MSEKGGQFTSGGGGSGGGSGGGGARPKVSEVSVSGSGSAGWLGRKPIKPIEPIKPSARAMAAVNNAVNAMPAQHAALLKDVKVQVYARSHDIKFNGEVGFTNVYDKAKNTISIADVFGHPAFEGSMEGPLASVEHNTMQALAAALDDKLNGAGHRAMIDAFTSERGPLMPREQVAGRWFLGDDVLEGLKTMFIELYAVAYSPDNSYKEYFGSMTRERAAQVFAPELAKIKKLAM